MLLPVSSVNCSRVGKSRRGKHYLGRCLGVDIDIGVEIECRAAAGARQIGLGGQDFDRRQDRRRWRRCRPPVPRCRPFPGRPKSRQPRSRASVTKQDSGRADGNAQATISRRRGPPPRPVEIRIAGCAGRGPAEPRRKSGFIGRCGADATRTVALPRQFCPKRHVLGLKSTQIRDPVLTCRRAQIVHRCAEMRHAAAGRIDQGRNSGLLRCRSVPTAHLP